MQGGPDLGNAYINNGVVVVIPLAHLTSSCARQIVLSTTTSE